MNSENAYLELWLIRHGETEWNRAKRLQGHSDIELSARGLAQAELLAQRLVGVPFDAVYASDLQRARRTAEVAFPGRQLLLERRLREMSLGVLEGRSGDELPAPERHVLDLIRSGDTAARADGGESYADVIARVGAWCDELPRRGRVACVTHGGVIGSLLRLVQDRLAPGAAVPWPSVANVSITVVRFAAATASIERVNDHAHLAHLAGAD